MSPCQLNDEPAAVEESNSTVIAHHLEFLVREYAAAKLKVERTCQDIEAMNHVLITLREALRCQRSACNKAEKHLLNFAQTQA